AGTRWLADGPFTYLEGGGDVAYLVGFDDRSSPPQAVVWRTRGTPETTELFRTLPNKRIVTDFSRPTIASHWLVAIVSGSAPGQRPALIDLQSDRPPVDFLATPDLSTSLSVFTAVNNRVYFAAG